MYIGRNFTLKAFVKLFLITGVILLYPTRRAGQSELNTTDDSTFLSSSNEGEYCIVSGSVSDEGTFCNIKMDNSLHANRSSFMASPSTVFSGFESQALTVLNAYENNVEGYDVASTITAPKYRNGSDDYSYRKSALGHTFYKS
jgi:hypothetical protein